MLQFVPTAFSPVLGHHGIKSGLAPSLQALIYTDFHPSRLNSLQHSQTGEMLQSLRKISSPLVNSFQCACICLVLGSPELAPLFQVWAPLSRRITPLAYWEHPSWSQGDGQPSLPLISKASTILCFLPA